MSRKRIGEISSSDLKEFQTVETLLSTKVCFESPTVTCGWRLKMATVGELLARLEQLQNPPPVKPAPTTDIFRE